LGGIWQKLLPPYSEIPEEFKCHNRPTKWNTFFNDMFFNGISNLRLAPKEGIDGGKALRRIRAIAASFEPKHEHKESGIAYLMSQWFDDVKYDKRAPHGK